MTKKDLGCNCKALILITIYDDYIPNRKKGLIVYMEVDMNENSVLLCTRIIYENKRLAQYQNSNSDQRIWSYRTIKLSNHCLIYWETL